MGRKHENTHATFYDQRQTRDSTDESKRRKMIRWIKAKIGIPQDGQRSQHHKPSSSRSSLSQSHSSGRETSFTSAYMGNPYSHQHMSREQRTHVIIVGGGIGGLCLAQGLKKNGIPFTVFERDPTPNYRTQGYRLRINSSGYEALKANLSPDNFEVFLRSTGHFLPEFKYMDAETGGPAPANVAFSHKTTSVSNVFSADRAMLRSLLLMDLNEYELQYGHAFKRYDMLPNGRVQVSFDNGRIVEGSVLIGADGTTSRVRRQYIPRAATLLDTDSGAIYGKTPITPEIEAFFSTESTTLVTSHKPMMSLVMEPRCSSQVNLREYTSMATSGLPDLQEYICWVLIARAQHFHVSDDISVQDLFSMSPAEVAELSCEMTKRWSPKVRQIFEGQAPEWCSFLRISTMSPDLRIWQPSSVTLIGDAVHTMTPAGIGCNTALQDARILVKYFKEYGVGVDAIASYERRMREYGREGINVSIAAGKQMFDLPSVEQMRAVVY
uniref:FAD-binding domain-containing protein n=1 Tax=Globisporangium ultimum (strain ATCC 200006 / CBS 805.95 / DAOM BR144) TaxID=431595 RepID=K3WTH5_GLOUD